MTEVEFENGIIARDKNNPNLLVLINSNGIGISRDGGASFKDAITADGFVLSAGAIGYLEANHIKLGGGTLYEDGYNPLFKETPQGAQDNGDDAKIGAETQIKEDLRVLNPLPQTIMMNQDGITSYAENPNGSLNLDKYARFDSRGLYIKGGAILIDGGLPDSAIQSASTWDGAVDTANEALNEASGSIKKDVNYNSTYITSSGIIVKNSSLSNTVRMGAFVNGGATQYGIISQHKDGTYTQLTDNGLERWVNGSAKPYMYLTHVGAVVTPTAIYYNFFTHMTSGGYWEDWWAKMNIGNVRVTSVSTSLIDATYPTTRVNVPSDFYGKDFSVVLFPRSPSYPAKYKPPNYTYGEDSDGETWTNMVMEWQVAALGNAPAITPVCKVISKGYDYFDVKSYAIITSSGVYTDGLTANEYATFVNGLPFTYTLQA